MGERIKLLINAGKLINKDYITRQRRRGEN
jgi:hypothetical protein